MPPTVLQALRSGAAAVRRCAWLGPVGLVIALLRTLLVLPAQLFAFALVNLGAAAWVAEHGPLPGVAARGLAIVAASPRFLGVAIGLWLAGTLLAVALRVAWLAGALPTLGDALSGGPPRPAFASGFARGFAHLLPTALLALVAELLAGAIALGTAGAAALVTARHAGAPAPFLPALAVSAAAVAALLLVGLVGALTDAALCRATVSGERAGRAFGRAALRVGARPAAFLALGLATLAASVVLGGSADAFSAMGAGAAAAAHPILLVGPQLLAMAIGALVAAYVELWRLASVAVLACHA